MRRPLTSLLIMGALAAAGCGDQADQQNDNEQPTRNAQSGPLVLPADDVATVIEAQRTIAAACGTSSTRNASTADPQALRGVVARVAQLTDENPDDRFETGQTDGPQTMTSVAKDLASALERCGQTALATELRDVATGLEPVQKTTPGY